MSEQTSTRKNMPRRLLQLLSLLQTRREWSGTELADRLGVSDRTLRRDIDRLRALDYSVTSTSGTAGGYRMTTGKALPPLLLDDEEAIAIAIALITAGGIAGMADSSAQALAKLERVLPMRLRPRLVALGATAAAMPAHTATRTDPLTLAVLAGCCRDQQLVAFRYRSRHDADSARRVEAHHLVTAEGRWYLIAYDPAPDDWRTFRVDRITNPLPAHTRFRPRALPAPDPVTYLTRSLTATTYDHQARLVVGLDADTLRTRLFAPIPGTIESDGPHACTVVLTAESAELVAQYVAAITALDAEVTVLNTSDEVITCLHTVRDRLRP